MTNSAPLSGALTRCAHIAESKTIDQLLKLTLLELCVYIKLLPNLCKFPIYCHNHHATAPPRKIIYSNVFCAPQCIPKDPLLLDPRFVSLSIVAFLRSSRQGAPWKMNSIRFPGSCKSRIVCILTPPISRGLSGSGDKSSTSGVLLTMGSYFLCVCMCVCSGLYEC